MFYLWLSPKESGHLVPGVPVLPRSGSFKGGAEWAVPIVPPFSICLHLGLLPCPVLPKDAAYREVMGSDLCYPLGFQPW